MHISGVSDRVVRAGRSACVAVVLLLIALAAGACSGKGSGAENPGATEVAATEVAATQAGCGAALTREGGEFSVEVGGRERDPIIHVPSPIDATPLPVVIGLHGYTGRAADFAEYTELMAKADESGFIAVFPQGYGAPSLWHLPGLPSSDPQEVEEELAFFDGLIDRLVESPCVDAERVYVAGHSMGGGMAAVLGCERAERLAGIALIAAEHFDTPCQPSRPIPVVSFHAVDDPVLPYEGGEVGGTAPGFPHVLAVEAVASAWAEHNACTSGPNSEELEDGIVVLTWAGCAAPVVHYRLPIGEHRWPGGVGAAGYEDGPDAMSATDVLWDLFSSSGQG